MMGPSSTRASKAKTSRGAGGTAWVAATEMKAARSKFVMSRGRKEVGCLFRKDTDLSRLGGFLKKRPKSERKRSGVFPEKTPDLFLIRKDQQARADGPAGRAVG